MGNFGNFGGKGGMGNMQGLLQQAQKMQQQVAEAQQELEESELVGTSGGGKVSVVVTGKKAVKSITINPEIVDKDDIELLEDLILAAINDAYNQADELSSQKLGAFGNLGGLI